MHVLMNSLPVIFVCLRSLNFLIFRGHINFTKMTNWYKCEFLSHTGELMFNSWTFQKETPPPPKVRIKIIVECTGSISPLYFHYLQCVLYRHDINIINWQFKPDNNFWGMITKSRRLDYKYKLTFSTHKYHRHK